MYVYVSKPRSLFNNPKSFRLIFLLPVLSKVFVNLYLSQSQEVITFPKHHLVFILQLIKYMVLSFCFPGSRRKQNASSLSWCKSAVRSGRAIKGCCIKLVETCLNKTYQYPLIMIIPYDFITWKLRSYSCWKTNMS